MQHNQEPRKHVVELLGARHTLMLIIPLGAFLLAGFFLSQGGLSHKLALSVTAHHAVWRSGGNEHTSTAPLSADRDVETELQGEHVSVSAEYPYGWNPWLTDSDPECLYYGPVHGLFEPSTPHPRYIVTGGAGFIGSHLVQRLAAELGPGQVKVVDNFANGRMAHFQGQNGSWVINPQKDVCACDLRIESQARKYLRGADYVYHLAAAVAAASSDHLRNAGAGAAHQLASFQDTIQIDRNTVRACRANNITRYIYVSSTQCGSPPQRKQIKRHVEGEEFSRKSQADLGTTLWDAKLLGEYEASMAHGPAFAVGIVRLTTVFGPRSNFSGHPGSQLAFSVLHDALHSGPHSPVIVQYARRAVVGDLIYVDDVVDALLRVRPRVGALTKGVAHVGSGHLTTWKQLGDTATSVVAGSVNKTVQVHYRRNSLAGSIHCSPHGSQQAWPLPGWRPQYSLLEGLQATLQWMLHEQTKPRVLVVLYGQPRGGELAWKSIHKHLVLPHNAHLALLLTPMENTATANQTLPQGSAAAPKRSLLERMAHWIWRVPEPADGDWGVWLDQAAALCPQRDGLKWSDLCATKGLWGGGFRKCQHVGKAGIVIVCRWIATQKIMLYNLHKQYDHIIFSRSDFLHFCDHHLVHQVNGSKAAAVGVVEGQSWGGYCDRHLVGTSPVMLRALNVTQELTCNAGAFHNDTQHGRMMNPESLQARTWAHMGMPVRQFPLTMFLVRASGDPAAFAASRGQSHPELESYGLKVKYMDELRRSLTACQVANITRSIELIKLHTVHVFD